MLEQIAHPFRTRTLEKLKKVLEWIIVFVVVVRAIFELADLLFGLNVTDFIFEHASDLLGQESGFVREIFKAVWNLIAASALIGVIALTYILRHRSRQIAGLHIRIGSLHSALADLGDFRRSYQDCENIFHSLSSENARHDAELFRYLFVKGKASYSADDMQERKIAIQLSLTVVRNNLSSVLEAAKNLFDSMTGSECFCCVQLLQKKEDQSIHDATVSTIFRDKYSSATRSTLSLPPSTSRVAGNTVHERIFIDGEEIVIVNDIAKAISEKKIKTTSTDAGIKYNSMIVAAIPSLDETLPISYSTFCIDTLSQFDDDKIKVLSHFARELSWRLGVMLYRLNALEAEYQLLSRGQSEGEEHGTP